METLKIISRMFSVLYSIFAVGVMIWGLFDSKNVTDRMLIYIALALLLQLLNGEWKP